uniref:hypothetical protein n=1 Tax=Candidatus Electrothrix sp. TaxID=2170559 RepID=UPI0040577A6B
MDRSYKYHKYNCSRFKRQVTITIEHIHPDPDNNDHKVAIGYECDSDRECDIATVDEEGISTWERALCPAVECVK